MKIFPVSGRMLPAAIWLFANASPGVRSMPITSPVDRISGPNTASVIGNLVNGSTASFTEMWSLLVGSWRTPL